MEAQRPVLFFIAFDRTEDMETRTAGWIEGEDVVVRIVRQVWLNAEPQQDASEDQGAVCVE